jgi:CBS domain-containing protein
MAARVMQQNDVGFLPVVDDETRRRVTGVVTDRDLCMRVVAAGRDPAQVPIRECLTANPITCGPDERVERALLLMETYLLRRLPVVDDEQCVVGVISLADLMHHVAANTREIYVALSRICEARRRDSGQFISSSGGRMIG